MIRGRATALRERFFACSETALASLPALIRSHSKSLAASCRRGFATERRLQILGAGDPGAVSADNHLVVQVQLLQCLGESNGRGHGWRNDAGCRLREMIRLENDAFIR